MSGLISGALGGLAKAAGGLAEDYIRDERQLNVAQQLSDMEEQRQMRIAERKQAMGRSDLEFESNLRQREKDADVERDLAAAPRRAQAEREATKAAGSDAEYLRASKALANSKRGDPQYSPETLANVEAARMALGDEKRRRQLLAERAKIEESNMRGDQRTRALARVDRELERLTAVRGSKKTDTDQDVVKKTERQYRYDDEGNKVGESVTESTERRRVPAGAPPKPAAQPAAGGKTATRAEVQAWAKARGLTEADAIKTLEGRGYTIR
jgi:hypothetical protein